MNTILVIAEHDQQKLKTATFNTLSAAREITGDITVLVVGANCASVADEVAKQVDVSRVLLADSPVYAHCLAENVAELIMNVAPGFTHILAPATTFGKDILPRVAALLDVAQISDITRVISADTFVRPIYAGNALATVQSQDLVKIITVRTTAFPATSKVLDNKVVIEKCDEVFAAKATSFIKHELSTSERPELTAARVIISGGRGMQNGENFKLLEILADRLNAAIGASRAAVDAGFVPNDYQVGQTGKVVAPELYIAIGISGAIQHLAGMKDSKVIVAINKDADAPIFQIADYGLVGDLFEIIPQLNAELDKLHSQN
jgi:electron transfer flavoprotein alpha subunit